MGHGSPCRCSGQELLELRDQLAARVDPPVRLGVLEFADPPRLPSLEGLLGELGGTVAAQPLLLFDGLHGSEDMPRLAAGARRRGLDLRVGQPFGDSHELVGLAVRRLREAQPGTGDLLLFVGRGTNGSRGREQTAAVAASVAAATELPLQLCYSGICQPDLVAGLRAAASRGPRRVLVLPYLIHGGILLRRVEEVLTLAARHLRLELALLPHLGNAPELLRLLIRRAQLLLGGKPR